MCFSCVYFKEILFFLCFLFLGSEVSFFIRFIEETSVKDVDEKKDLESKCNFIMM